MLGKRDPNESSCKPLHEITVAAQRVGPDSAESCWGSGEEVWTAAGGVGRGQRGVDHAGSGVD